jgi:hypothetical protein
MNLKEKIEFYTCEITDERQNKWKVIEASDLTDILETYKEELVKKLNIVDVSKSLCITCKEKESFAHHDRCMDCLSESLGF